MTEILMMTLMVQLRKIVEKREHRTHLQPKIDFRKLVDKLEHAEITLKLEETENLKLQYLNNIHTTTSQISIIHDSDTEVAEKIIKVLNI